MCRDLSMIGPAELFMGITEYIAVTFVKVYKETTPLRTFSTSKSDLVEFSWSGTKLAIVRNSVL